MLQQTGEYENKSVSCVSGVFQYPEMWHLLTFIQLVNFKLCLSGLESQIAEMVKHRDLTSASDATILTFV